MMYQFFAGCFVGAFVMFLALMGFELNRRFTRTFNNERVNVKIAGKVYHFSSKLEFRWAMYLEFLRKREAIRDWQYEPKIFVFHDEETAPVQYRPDFSVIEKDGTEVYQQCSG